MVDFSDNSPSAAATLAHVYPYQDDRDETQDYALVDLFFRTQKAMIYNEPFKVAAVTSVLSPDCLPFPEFLLWSYSVLDSLCQNDIPEAFIDVSLLT